MCNGAVVKEIGKSLVKVCTDGKVKLKPRKQVGFYFNFAPWQKLIWSIYFLGIKDESVISSTYNFQNLLLGWGGLCTGRSRHWPREGLHLVRNDFLRWRSGGRPLQMVVSHEVLKVKVHRCQRPLHSSRPGSKIQVLVLPDALNFPSAHSAFWYCKYIFHSI